MSEIKDTKNIVTASAQLTAGGNIIVGDDNVVLNLKEAAQYYNLESEIENLERRKKKTLVRIENYPTDSGFRKDLIEINTALDEKQAEKRLLVKEVLKLAETFSKISINTERLKKTESYFRAGAFKEARAILDADKMTEELDCLLKEKKKNEENLQSKADEFLILAKLTAINFDIADRFEKAIEYYEKSITANRTIDNIFSYAYFLQEHNQNNKATPLYLEALAIRRKLAEKHPQTYLPVVGMTLINMSIFYQYSKINKDLSIKLVDEAINSLSPFDEIPYIQNYLNGAFNVLRDWGIDVEEYLNEKRR